MHRMVAVIGNGEADPGRDRLAEEVGALLARSGYGLVCGGLGLAPLRSLITLTASFLTNAIILFKDLWLIDLM